MTQSAILTGTPRADPTYHGELLTVLNYSGGTGSAAILWMLLMGEIEMPHNLVVLNADPGMEDERTYAYNAQMFDRCSWAGIKAYTVDGPNLYLDLTEERDGQRRVDNPPYWVAKAQGGRGRLMQKCTSHYKIKPMDREVRRILHETHGIHPQSGRLPAGGVLKLIGFTHDEQHRVKPSQQAYQRFAYPLIDRGLDRVGLKSWYRTRGLEMPPRSVCVACFANNKEHFVDMARGRPADFAKAVAVDEALRAHLHPVLGISDDNKVYVSATLKPLSELVNEPDQEAFDGSEEHGCETEYCFI